MNEKLSSLFDNELSGNEIDRLLDQSSKQKKNTHWTHYQLIRDVIQNNHLGSHNLTKNIIDAIEKEPTQLGGFGNHKNEPTVIKLQHWPIAASFAALFVVGLTALNLDEFKATDSAVLAESDIPVDLINDHYANASTNANLFIQASYRK
jgi:negative regulator of sigma E activity